MKYGFTQNIQSLSLAMRVSHVWKNNERQTSRKEVNSND